uniref:Uncharacterized protein n=1 Tax=Utricularia reniformis TaxID=192314 RepID=A0A1Y0AYW2_9LAMI|nr:hypothetical protein AEK19_MT0967 [Utricularia reniformis]ART30337.1 hypothetical protein AEK19_MT0967 [Utricularia reniformis]
MKKPEKHLPGTVKKGPRTTLGIAHSLEKMEPGFIKRSEIAEANTRTSFLCVRSEMSASPDTPISKEPLSLP